ncbi:MAG TPA: hypothetical protein VFU59_08435 [Candidatus Eisenbacteria bacterium]|nr:hypothetical protein [Candidatus Eisenbacteria bacterium]
MASASASSLRLVRSLSLALGFAVLLAAAPGASVVPAVAATRASAEVRQEPIDPTEDPNDVPFVPPTDGDEEEDEEDESDTDSLPPQPAYPDKPNSIVPDSLRTGGASSIPFGGAPSETLGFKPAGVGADPTAKAAPVKPKVRGTPFGIHPAALFAALLAAHVFLVRWVTD